MRRFAALFLILWTCVCAPALPPAAAASDQPIECACCKGGPCRHQSCAIPTTGAPTLCPLNELTRLAPLPAGRAEASARRLSGRFFAFFNPIAASVSATAARFNRAPAPASVPLFKAQCRFLI